MFLVLADKSYPTVAACQRASPKGILEPASNSPLAFLNRRTILSHSIGPEVYIFVVHLITSCEQCSCENAVIVGMPCKTNVKDDVFFQWRDNTAPELLPSANRAKENRHGRSLSCRLASRDGRCQYRY